MCGPPKEQCDGNEDIRLYDRFFDEEDPGLTAERVRHLTHDEQGNKYPDA